MRTAVATTLLALLSANASAACTASRPEAWEPFFTQYSSSSQFALSRTRFPLSVLVWEFGVDEKGRESTSPRKSTVSPAEFAKGEALALHARANGLKLRTKTQSATAVTVELFKEDTDYLVDYHFQFVNGCWFLRQIEDHSL
jgi:hypothetical protein